MSAEETIKAWHDDSAQHAIIWCHDWTPLSAGCLTHCETCQRPVAAWPVVIEKVRMLPRFHVICRAKCMAISLRFGQIPFGGRIRENELPIALQKACEEKPR